MQVRFHRCLRKPERLGHALDAFNPKQGIEHLAGRKLVQFRHCFEWRRRIGRALTDQNCGDRRVGVAGLATPARCEGGTWANQRS
jgi:hypothetical protein